MAFTYDPEIDIDEIPDELSDEAQFLEDRFIEEGFGKKMDTRRMAKKSGDKGFGDFLKTERQEKWSEAGGMETAQMAGAAAQLVAGGIGMLDKTEEVDAPNYISDMLGMAGQGASMGATFGPWGVGIGAAVGAGAGLIKAVTSDKATNARIQERETQEKKFAQAASTTQTNPMFAKHGIKAPSKAHSYLENMKIQSLNMSKAKDREASISANPYSYMGYNRPQSESPTIAEIGRGFTGTAGVRGQGYLPFGDIGSASLDYDTSATLSSQGIQGQANVNLSADLNPTDRLNISPYLNYNMFSGGSNMGVGATARYRFDDGGKVRYTDKTKYDQAMRERQEAIDMYNRGLEWYMEDIDWNNPSYSGAHFNKQSFIDKYRQAGISGDKHIQEVGGRLGGSSSTAYSFEVFPYPTQTPYYEEPKSYIPFVTQAGDTLNMSGDIQGAGANRALEEGWDSRISYLNQLNQLSGK
tara:strand:- start:8 stop:1411 length:1404 start_codon:yes stop_codon:yes gene_type:complete